MVPGQVRGPGVRHYFTGSMFEVVGSSSGDSSSDVSTAPVFVRLSDGRLSPHLRSRGVVVRLSQRVSGRPREQVPRQQHLREVSSVPGVGRPDPDISLEVVDVFIFSTEGSGSLSPYFGGLGVSVWVSSIGSPSIPRGSSGVGYL